MMRFVRNPEILRHVWLELSPTRLIGLALVLVALYALTGSMTDSRAEFLEACRAISLFGLAVLPGLWGTRLTVDSLAREIHDRTWEFQRMTPLGPWEMTLGKLVGGPIYAWYAALLLAPPYLLSSWGLGDPSAGVRDLFHLGLAILFFHGLGLIVALTGIRKARAGNAEMPRGMPFYLMVALGLFLWTAGTPLSHFGRSRLRWFGTPLDHPAFLTGTLLFFAFWAVFGAVRCMGRELRMGGGAPWAWTIFLLTLMGYAAGFEGFGSEWEISGRAIQAGIVGLSAAYGAMFAEVHDPVASRRFFAAVEAGDWGTASESLPLWVVPVILTGGICAFLAVAPDSPVSGIFPVAVYLFLLRDMGLVLLARRIARPRRADAAAAVWLLLLYVLCPMIAAASGMESAIALFAPIPGEYGSLSIAAAFGQTVAVSAFLARRKTRRGEARR